MSAPYILAGADLAQILTLARKSEAKRQAMLRALKAKVAEGGYMPALRVLQAIGDNEAAHLVYVMMAAEDERTGNTWAAVEEAMKEAA